MHRKQQGSRLAREAAPLRSCFSLFRRLFSHWPSRLLVTAIVAIVASFIFFTPADAKTFDQMTPSERAKSWAYSRVLERCLNMSSVDHRWPDHSNALLLLGRNNRISDESAKSYQFFMNNPRGFRTGMQVQGYGHFLGSQGIGDIDNNNDKGAVWCSAGSGTTPWLQDALNLWGWSSPIDFLCDIGAERDDNRSCRESEASFKPFTWAQAEAAIKQKVYGGGNMSMGSSGDYLYDLATFRGACSTSPYTGDSRDDSFFGGVRLIEGFGDDARIVPTDFYSTRHVRTSNPTYKPGVTDNIRCHELVERINNNAEAYLLWARTASEEDVRDSQPINPGPAEGTTSCIIEGVGWIVCPMMNFLADIGDAAYGVIENFLAVNTEIMDTSSGTYSAWRTFRDIANVAFVLVFIIIIYSQITGAGISSYGVKKMLPRLIIAAILVNVSYFVCQLMVDVTQIMGATLKEFLVNMPTTSVGDASGVDATGWRGRMGPILAGTIGVVAGAAGVAVLALSVSIPVLLAFVLAVLMTVIILIGRQAAIVIFIVLAPLAFVAYLLPNTESLFRKWLKMFWGLLMVYPIVALLYGGGHLAARIINNAGGGDFWISLTALGVSAIPLIMTPFLLKGSLNATGKLGAKMQGWGNKASGNVRSQAMKNSRLGEAAQGVKNKFAVRRATKRAKSNFDRGWAGRALGLDAGAARAAGLVEAEDDKEVKNAAALMKMREEFRDPNTRLNSAQTEYIDAIRNGNSIRARAAQSILLSGGGRGLALIEEAVEGNQNHANSTAMASMRNDLVSSGIKSKSAALDSWAVSSDGNLATIRGTASTYSRLSDGEISTQIASNFEGAMNSGVINADNVGEFIGNDTVRASISRSNRDTLRQRFGNSLVPHQPEDTTEESPEARTPQSTTTPTHTTPQITSDDLSGLNPEETRRRVQQAINESQDTNTQSPPETTPNQRPTMSDLEAQEEAYLDVRRNSIEQDESTNPVTPPQTNPNSTPPPRNSTTPPTPPTPPPDQNHNS